MNTFRHRFRAAGALAATLLLVAAASFAAETYTIDKVHSGVSFRIRHFATMVPGSFSDFSGTIVFDEEDVTKSSVEAVIQTASVNTNNANRDAHLRNEDFFNVEKFSTITFKSKKVEGFPEKFKVTGDFTMLGVTKEVVLMVDYFGKIGGRPGFSATTEINRKDFGMTWNRALDVGGFVLGDAVRITLDIQAVPQKKEAPAEEKKEEPKKEAASSEESKKS